MVHKVVRACLGLAVTFSLGTQLSCATSFVGDARFPGGALGCFKQCQRVGMEMASFVYVGEYSTACACKTKTTAAATAQPSADGDIEGAVVAAAAGVELQRRAAEAQQHGLAGSVIR